MRLRTVLAAVPALALLGGCSFGGVQDLPLPGAVHGSDTYRVTVVVADATNLVPNETCRMHDAIVGSVESVTLGKDLRAHVVCRIRRSVRLPGNVRPTLAETSLLGERYVALDPAPGVQPRGVLAQGATIAVAKTQVSPNVEVVLGALAQVLNGGSLGKAASITDELTTVLKSTDVPATLRELDRFTATLDANRTTLVDTLDSLDRFAAGLAKQRQAIADAIDSVPGGLRALEQERPEIVSTLGAVQDLSRRAVTVIDRSRQATVADLRRVEPVVQQLADSGQDLALLIERLSSFPFPSNSMAMLRGDYGGAMADVVVDADMLNQLLMPEATTEPAPKAPTAKPTKPADPLAQLPLDSLMKPAPKADVGGIVSGLLGGGTP
ncbi:MAG: MCE family protein [Nocardioides sp.]|nr:MCE family protein [Nocardioides sp.]